MLNFITQHKVLAALAVGFVALGLWFFLSGGGTPESTSLLTTEVVTDTSGTAAGTLIETLIELRSIQLNGAIFQDPAFLALHDFSTDITPEPVGRPNPFAPLSRTPASGTSNAAGTTIFSQPPTPVSNR